MSFFPGGFDPRDAVLGMFDLCVIDTRDGPVRFMIGTDGVFVDVASQSWVGSRLIGVSSLQTALDGAAPEGSITLSFFQDPGQADLIAQVRALGFDYVDGRAITFLIQPLRSQADMQAPALAPVQWMRRTIRSLSFNAGGAQDRSITLGFEAWSERRRAARRLVLNTEGHARLTGAPNPSLEFMPTTDFEEEKLFG